MVSTPSSPWTSWTTLKSSPTGLTILRWTVGHCVRHYVSCLVVHCASRCVVTCASHCLPRCVNLCVVYCVSHYLAKCVNHCVVYYVSHYLANFVSHYVANCASHCLARCASHYHYHLVDDYEWMNIFISIFVLTFWKRHTLEAVKPPATRRFTLICCTRQHF